MSLLFAFFKRNINSIILWGALACGGFIRLAGIGSPSLWYDELYTLRASGSPLSAVISEALVSRHLPSYYLALHFWTQISENDAWVRLISVTAGIVTIVLAYAIGRRLFSERAGLWGAAFVSFSPFLIWYSRDATVYSWAMAAALSSFYFLIRATQNGGVTNWVLFLITSIISLFSHFYSVLFLLAEVPFFFFMYKPAGRQLKSWIFCQICLALALIPWLLGLQKATTYYTNGSLPGISFPSIKAIYKGFEVAPVTFIKGYAYTLGRGEGTLFLSRNHEILLAGFLSLIILLLITNRYGGTRYRRNIFSLAVFVILAICLPVFVHLAQGEYISGRYYSLAAPAFFVFLAAMISALPAKVSWMTGSFLVILMIFIIPIQRSNDANENWRGLMTTVASESKTGDEYLCFPYHHCIVAQDHYRLLDDRLRLPVRGGASFGDQPRDVWLPPAEYIWSGFGEQGPEVDQIDDQQELDQRLEQSLLNAKRVWFVSGDGSLGNPQRATIIEQTLSGEWDVKKNWDFPPLVLVLYERKT